MKNPVTTIMNNLTNEQLVNIIKEIKKADSTGYFDEGSEYRNLVSNISKDVIGDYGTFMTLTIILVFKEFTYRQLNLK